ncbi:metallophosphoesterase family protein [Candidatus Woesearchaeota archaeon]|nr:metallophosphoesterase family protein [Candidatus Woesearchaeota archaeon]
MSLINKLSYWFNCHRINKALKNQQPVAVISDVLGNRGALEAVLADIETRNPAVIVNLGNLVGGKESTECIEMAMERKIISVRGNYDISAARAKLERASGWDDVELNNRQVSYLRDLQAVYNVGYAYFTHATPLRRELLALPNGTDKHYPTISLHPAQNTNFAQAVEGAFERADADIIFVGHTCIPAIIIKDGQIFDANVFSNPYADNERFIANPGSVGELKDFRSDRMSGLASYAMLHQRKVSFHTVTYQQG